MKTCLRLLSLCLLIGAQFFGIAMANQDPSLVPIPLMNADETYKEKCAEAFLPALLQGVYPEGMVNTTLVKAPLLERASAFINTLQQIETFYGRYMGLELIVSVPIANSTRVVYYVLNYERGPLYGALTAYKTK